MKKKVNILIAIIILLAVLAYVKWPVSAGNFIGDEAYDTVILYVSETMNDEEKPTNNSQYTLKNHENEFLSDSCNAVNSRDYPRLYNDVIKIMNTGKYTRDLLDNFVPEDNLTGFMDIDMVVIFQKDGITKEFTFYDNKNVKIKDSLERYYRVDDDIYSKLLEYYKNINKNTAS